MVVMNTEKIGDLYFQKAESMRVTRLGFEAASVIGFLFTVATLVLGQSPEETASDILFMVVFMLVVVIAILVFDLLFRMGYEEYRTEYLSFYCIPYVNDYLQSHPGIDTMRDAEMDAVAETMSRETGFDRNAVRDGVRVHLIREYKRETSE